MEGILLPTAFVVKIIHRIFCKIDEKYSREGNSYRYSKVLYSHGHPNWMEATK